MTEKSWVEVRDEPRHHRRFENDYARVYDVKVPPGDRTLFHRHTEDTLYVCIASSRIEDQTWGQDETACFDVPPELAMCRPHREEPLIHRIRNLGESGMRMIGAEVRRSPATTAPEPLDHPNHTFEWETPRLRAYRLELAPGETSSPIRYAFSGVTISLVDADLESRDAGGATRTHASAAGDVVWHDGPLRFELCNRGEAPYRAHVVEWR